MRRGDIGVVLRDPLVALDDPAPDIGSALGVDEGLERGTDRVRLRLESGRRDEPLELLRERIRYANRYLY